jgi:hypothetical protein
MDSFTLQQVVPVTGGSTYGFSVAADARVSPDNRSFFRLTWRDAEGRSVGQPATLRLPNATTEGWRDYRLIAVAPSAAVSVAVTTVVNRQKPGDYLKLDDYELRQISSE